VYRRRVLGAGVRTTIARCLEEGSFSGRTSRLLARAHASFASRSVARPLVIPRCGHATAEPHLLTVTVGGATIGGSGKTRVALACTRELASLGASVVLIGHAYRARPRAARVVSPSDVLDDVGDEALASARALADVPDARGTRGARVVVAPDRQSAIDFAASLSPRVDVVVIDGPLQLAPSPASLSVLALDAEAPWGAGHVPPAGDLRAPREALLAHADHVALVDAAPQAVLLDAGRRPVDLASFAASSAGLRLGLFTALGRPERLVRALARAGIAPDQVVRAPDHGPLPPNLGRHLVDLPVDLWLATTKCALHLEALRRARSHRARLAILDGSLMLPPSLALGLARLVGPR
jgi:tetraacyldisaccharide-1-P 4'-kinase